MDKLLGVLKNVEDRAVNRVKTELEKQGLTWNDTTVTLTKGDTTFTVSSDKVVIKAKKIEIEGEAKLNGKEIVTE